MSPVPRTAPQWLARCRCHRRIREGCRAWATGGPVETLEPPGVRGPLMMVRDQNFVAIEHSVETVACPRHLHRSNRFHRGRRCGAADGPAGKSPVARTFVTFAGAVDDQVLPVSAEYSNAHPVGRPPPRRTNYPPEQSTSASRAPPHPAGCRPTRSRPPAIQGQRRPDQARHGDGRAGWRRSADVTQRTEASNATMTNGPNRRIPSMIPFTANPPNLPGPPRSSSPRR